ncbi:MAG: hypothetical protein GYA55_04830, partial [SAR324 cluster bacterium]|nr:hypothetical protein [SAR324 cluster bacterium]
SGLKHLEKLLKFVDLRFIAILISRYVEIITYDDANDSPPGSGFYTPDKGFTWIGIHDLDATRAFYLNRFLALIFDNDAALFYQLCAIPMVSTPSLLEEESYKDRCTRISAEGVPELEYAFELTAPLQPYAIKKQINAHGLKSAVENIPIIEPLLYDTSFVQPLSSLVNSNLNLDELEMELTLILNAAIVRWQIPFFEAETIKHWSEKVKGAINLGLEDVIKTSNLPLIDIYRILGLQKLFRLGLWHLMELQKIALKIPVALIEPGTLSAENFSILACAREEIPEIPNFFNKDGSIQSEEGTLVPGTKAIEHLEEIQMLKKRLEDLFNN